MQTTPATRTVKAALGFLLVAAVLAGCAGSQGASFTIARTIDMDLHGMPQDDLEGYLASHSNTTFSLTATAGAQVADLAVRYVNETGQTRTDPLSRFTAASTLKAGDVVQVPGAALWSNLTVLEGDRAVASRSGVERDWLQAAGAPLPLASETTGGAHYAWNATLGLDFHFDHAGYARDRPGAFTCNVDAHNHTRCGVAQIHTSFAFGPTQYTYSQDAKGTLDLDATPLTTGGRLTLTGAAQSGLDTRLDSSLRVTEKRQNETRTTQDGPLGFIGHATGSADVLLKLDFSGLQVRSVTHRIHGHAEGSLSFWNDTASQAHPIQAPLPDPLFDAQGDDATEEVTPAPLDAAADVALRIFGMTAAPGDRLTAQARYGNATDGVEAGYDVVAVAEEPRTVSGATVPALRLRSLSTTVALAHGVRHSFQGAESTYWVASESGLPVRIESHVERTLQAADARALLDPLARLGGPDLDLPSDVTLSLRSDSVLDARSFEPGVAVPGYLAASYGLLPISLVGALAAH